jgi:hypothetical protein
MRTRLVSLAVMLALPAALSAQIIRAPRRPTTPGPVALPPTGGAVAQVLELHRSRWSSEAYSLFSDVRVPAGGGTANYATFGAGTHGGYRISDRFTGTADVTTSQFGSPMSNSTMEVGTRFMPIPFDADIRPFVDVRGSYMWLEDNFALPTGQSAAADYSVSRFGHGFGGIMGGGFEYSLTNSFALSTELSAIRGRMTTYNTNNTAGIPIGSGYWMTSYRLTLGLKYSATRVAHMAAQPR